MSLERYRFHQDLMALNSLYFLNSDPLVDFPRPSAARVIDIGGVAVSNGHKELNEVSFITLL